MKRQKDGDILAKLSKVQSNGISSVSEESSDGTIMDAYNECERKERLEVHQNLIDRIKEVECRQKRTHNLHSKSITKKNNQWCEKEK